MSEIETESRKAFRELLDALGEIDRRRELRDDRLGCEVDASFGLEHAVGAQERSAALLG